MPASLGGKNKFVSEAVELFSPPLLDVRRLWRVQIHEVIGNQFNITLSLQRLYDSRDRSQRELTVHTPCCRHFRILRLIADAVANYFEVALQPSCAAWSRAGAALVSHNSNLLYPLVRLYVVEFAAFPSRRRLHGTVLP